MPGRCRERAAATPATGLWRYTGRRFKTAPSMRFIQLTDCHIYADSGARFSGMDTRASCTAVIDAAAQASAAGLLLTGDLSMDGQAAAYVWLDQALSALPALRLVIAGNHDAPDQWCGSLAQAPGHASVPGWQIHGLDTRVAGAPHGTLQTAQLAALDAALAAAPGVAHLLLMHHPPLPVGSPWIDAMGVTNAAALWSLLAERPGVRAIVCGHVHQNVDCYHNGVRVLTTPSTCVQFTPRCQDYAVDRRHPGYRIVDLDPAGELVTRVERVPLARQTSTSAV